MAEHAIYKTRRSYNRWVANQTLEDYALRFTAKKARRWSISRVANTALGAISFLALEAIGGTITLHYGFDNALIAILLVSTVIFLTGIPICYYAAKYGVDIDLLSRGAGFGYIGSTITSLIYASFTFIFFALEAAIMASALELLFNIPKSIGYLLCSLIVIPLVTHGITLISRFQLWSQPLWLILQLLPFVFILWQEWSIVADWSQHTAPNQNPSSDSNFNIIYFGAASGVLFSLMAQIGEQVDFLRFLPEPKKGQRVKWWAALICAGPGWIIVGALKIIAGSFLAVLALNHGVPADLASDPTNMYLIAFGYLNQSPNVTLALTGIFVIVCQLKINVTNAYAGSIAWSNFFSRLTHSHPGRVVWLVFNVIIALLLMELGVYNALERILGIYSNVAVAWVGALVADLVINKPLGLSPKYIEFKRAHLYDINPVGVGAMLIASTAGILCYSGSLGELARALSPYIALVTAFITSPSIALITKGRFYIARPSDPTVFHSEQANCTVCQNSFEIEDMTTCPAYGGAICSLCCSLDSSCNDQCKDGAKLSDQITKFVSSILPQQLVEVMNPRLLQFSGLLTLIIFIIAVLFWMVFLQIPSTDIALKEIIAGTLTQIFFLLIIIVGILTWLFVLANESRQMALEESIRQTSLLSKEILAHEKTDSELQSAKEIAESANLAKSRYLTGISHELRSPLNSILGYAQLLNHDSDLTNEQMNRVNIIRRSGEHLADLIEGLLDISRIEAGRLELHRDKVFIRDLLDDLIEMFQLQADAKGIEFEYRLTSYLPNKVIADEKHLRQILINLLSNAVKFTQSGKVSLTVHYRSQVAEFTITDTGVGIEEHKQELIFKPFERIRKPGESQIPGTGLGLTITKLLTEIMGGELTLTSSPKTGSTFKVTLMLSSIHEQDTKKTTVKKITSYKGNIKNVMVVDDDPTHRGLIKEILTPLRFSVHEASDSEACLKLIGTLSIDLLFLDISMPGISGIELATQLQDQQFKSPIIILSADATEDHHNIKNTGKRKVYEDYLIKPIRDTLLLDAVSNALNLEWCYEIDNNEQTIVPVKNLEETVLKTYDITEEDRREIISMAELGFADGVSKILRRIGDNNVDNNYLKKMNQYLDRFQFSEIIKENKESLHDD
ncbi:MAG: hybrid sensor histidine kinase/response regulator [Cellvibrionaceae bacterium]